MQFIPYTTFSRDEWARLRANTPLTLGEDDLAMLRGINENISLPEVEDVFLPLTRLLNLHVAASRNLAQVRDTFFGMRRRAGTPYIIGIAGSVAVGKSTFARVLRALLTRWPDHPRVDLVTTDNFLYPNRILQDRGLMRRKGFPESYDLREILSFLGAVRSGQAPVDTPVYSHVAYDILPDERQMVSAPDILIVEGLNVLQLGNSGVRRSPMLCVSDYFDFSIYLDAETEVIEEWYIDRFMALQRTAFQNPASYFHHYATLSEAKAREVAREIWASINRVNLTENILTTRERAELILTKVANHQISEVRLRRI